MVTSFIIHYPNTAKSARRNPQATMLASFFERQQVQRHQHAIFRAVTLGGPYQLRNPPYEGSMRILLEDFRFFSVNRVAES
jgi:hypothetical protein